MIKLTPPQLVLISFLCAIALGTIALSLPAATQGEEALPLIDSLFTATSATCVTGLIVRDTGSFFTSFGKWVIFLLFQAGGLGIMTFSTLFAVMLGRKIGFYQSDVIKSTLDHKNILGLKRLILYIVGITVTAETAGTIALYARWKAVTDWPAALVLERSVFHSVSGFCNAGFSLFRDSLAGYAADPYVNLTMMGLIVLGGIGFIVVMDVIGLFFGGGVRRRLSLQSKIALTVSAVLIVAGAAVLLFVEKDNAMRLMTWPERVWGSLFQSVTARTAGFNTVPISSLAVPSKLFLVLLMFIGASPGSTGGGIKTCTFAVLAMTVYSMMRNRRRVGIFGRSISRKVTREALVIFFLALFWVFACTMIISYMRAGAHAGKDVMMSTLFEVVSAFGTVGLSTGITADLDTVSKLCIIVTMFAGRVGPLTLALGLAFRERKETYVFPEETLMVG